MESNKTKRQRKLLFPAIEVTPVYRPLKFPLYREAVGDSDDEFDLSRTSSSTSLPVPATLGRRNLSLCWWLKCPRKCRAYRRDLIEDACDACFRIRGVREDGRTALSLQMVEVNCCGDLRVVARHSKTIKIVDKNGVRAKSLFDGEGKRRVVYLIVRDRRGPHEPTHTMTFALRFTGSEESSGVRKIESEGNGCAVSYRKLRDSSHYWTSQPPKETPKSTRSADGITRLAVTVSPKSARRALAHGFVRASFPNATKVVSNESVEKVATPTRWDDSVDMVFETTAQRTSEQRYAAFTTPKSRTLSLFDESTGLKGASSRSQGRDEAERRGVGRPACVTLPLRRRLAFEPEAPSDTRSPTSPVCESDHQRLSESDADLLVTQVERLIAPRSTQDSTQHSTQSAVLLLPREQLLTLSMQEATQTGLCLSPKPPGNVTDCRSLALRGWRRARAAAPNSFRRAVVDLIVHENPSEGATEIGTGLWLPTFLDCGCVMGPS